MFNFIKKFQGWNKYGSPKRSQKIIDRTLKETKVYMANDIAMFRHLKSTSDGLVIIEYDPTLKQGGLVEVTDREKKIEILIKHFVL